MDTVDALLDAGADVNALSAGERRNYLSGCLMANTALELGVSDSDVAAEVKRLFRGIEKILTGAVKKGQESREEHDPV